MGINDKDKESMLPYIVAVDFDGTLVENAFPEIGAAREPVFSAIKSFQKRGAKIILWTCRTEGYLQDAVRFCEEHGLITDAVNDNIDEVKALGWHARKVFANLYLDDRNCGIEAFVEVIKWVENNHCKQLS